MPPKIYFSDAQKANDLKKNQKTNKPKVVKSSAAQKTVKIRKPETKQVNNRKPTNAPNKVAVNKIKINIKNKPNPNVVKVVKQNPPQNKSKAKVPQSKLEKAIQTAKAISSNPSHFNHQNVKDLLNSFEKSWISAERFQELLVPMLV